MLPEIQKKRKNKLPQNTARNAREKKGIHYMPINKSREDIQNAGKF
jgi:hypothetical protein